MKKQTKKIIINLFFSIMSVVVFYAVIRINSAIEAGLPLDHPEAKLGLGLLFLESIFVFFHVVICYIIVWRSTYHLLTSRPRGIYTVVDVLSIVISVFPLVVMLLQILTKTTIVHGSIVKLALGMTYVMPLLRLFLWSYRIGDTSRQKPLPAADPASDTQLP